MDKSRRRFLKIAGFSVLGIGGVGFKPVIDAIAATGDKKFRIYPDALQGKRWGMVVDMSKCREGCTDCIDACHRAHNVPDFPNKKDEVKWLWKEPFENAFPTQKHPYVDEVYREKPFLVLCNHCDNPPCVRVCPTKATFQRKDGLVLMDFHRCIGCRYCMAACPYGARSLNWRDPRPYIKEGKTNREFPTRTRGVVEKCNFCAERLAKGLLPACVDACTEKALVFGDLEDANSEIRDILGKKHTIRRKPQLGTQPQVYYVV